MAQVKTPTLRETIDKCERSQIAQALHRHGPQLIGVAKALGISRTHLWRKLKKYNFPRRVVVQSKPSTKTLNKTLKKKQA